MENYVLRTHSVTKCYGDLKAVDNVDMTIKKGEIYGFIGRNGAGKTTLIRMITGLAHCTSGKIELFGKSQQSELVKARTRMGVVVESPALYFHMTAEQNMEHQRLISGITGKEQIQKALELAGINGAGKKKVRDFSLGMKQRLGLAMAMLNQPEFIILDEPANGLDPAGIVEMRNTIKRLARENNITFLISSHLLSELSTFATTYGIIHKGRIIRQLTETQLSEECRQYIKILVDDAKKAVDFLENTLHTKHCSLYSSNEIRLFDNLDRPDHVNEILVKAGFHVKGIYVTGYDLEEYFMDLTGGISNA